MRAERGPGTGREEGGGGTGKRRVCDVRSGVGNEPKPQVLVTFGEDLKFGDGRARLLEAIEERGSLKQAAKAFEMSYRNAWGYLRELEHAAGFKFVERAAGGGPESGMRLTEPGKRFLARYRTFRSALEESMTRHFEQSFKQPRATRPTRSTR